MYQILCFLPWDHQTFLLLASLIRTQEAPGITTVRLHVSDTVHRSCQVVDANCVPLSVVTVAGLPKRATHPAIKASATVLVAMSLKGTASIHLVDLSTIVRR